MRRVCMKANGTTAQGLAELTHHTRNEQKEVRDAVTGGEQGLSDEGESRINNDVDVNIIRKDLVQQPVAVQQRSLQQPQGPQGSVVRWERFLPIGTLKVLLVEFDDSTRHVVSALLRNCSYEVTAVANGVEAWKILQDLTNQIDLVLTEVAMPYLSGIGLLSKIMNHKTCKNIPVIMMSSNDSMGIVFKCLSKGAVDFLVKPIRKNELKNLWQHVWRKCHSSSGSGGSGSESGIRTQKSPKSKGVEGTGNNNSVSNEEDDIASISLNDRNGSDTGSGTQSSWTKRAVEVDSSQPMSPWDELADAPDSTCAQVIHLRPEAVSNNWVPTTGPRDEHGDIAMGKDLEIGVPGNSDLQVEDQSKKSLLAVAGSHKRKNLDSGNDGAKLEKDNMLPTADASNYKSKEAVADLMGVINYDNTQIDSVAAELPGDLSKTNIKDECRHDPKRIPSLDLSLKRPRDDADIEDTAHEQNVLRRSNLSAFSRYNTVSTANQTPTGIVGSCSPHDISSEAEKTGNLESNSNGTPNQRSNGSSNNNDMGSTTNNTFAKPAITDKAVPKTTVNIHPCSAFQPVRSSTTTPLQPQTPSKGDATAVDMVLAQPSGISSQVQVQHHHHHYHHHHHHVHNTTKKLLNNDDASLRTMPGPSTDEGNAANYDMNGSASGSNNGSNGQSGKCTAVITEGTNIGSENGLAGNYGAGAGACADVGSGNGSGSGVDQNRNAQREAALIKFRQKRKDRCFEKKVRYQSRKKLAEQRPRVRGQFVRQGKETDC